MKKPVVLMILDGWGLNDHQNEKNAIKNAHAENFNGYWNNYPHSVLEASGEAVGLPDGQMGNSEVGHLNIGSGRVIYQPLVKISKEIRDGEFLKNKPMLAFLKKLRENNSSLHLSGLLSDGGVHSHIKHIYGIIKMAKKEGIKHVFIHPILDGRDTPPKSATKYIEALEINMKKIGLGEISTVGGRFYAMDRDKRWERLEQGYRTIVDRKGPEFDSAIEALNFSYSRDLTDEFVIPSVIKTTVDSKIKDNDGFMFFDFRPDRARELTHAITDRNFKEFDISNRPFVHYMCMTQYDETFDLPVAYPSESISNTLGEIFAKQGLNQLRIAETEKYAHVTFFFNGGVESPNKNEDRKLISSPKVETYDMQPEMSAHEVTQTLLKKLSKDEYDVVIINYANPDMVGHTGKLAAAVSAIKTIDKCLDEVIKDVIAKDGIVLLTADHGNADKMEDPITHEPWTAHTTNPVPFILISNENKNLKLKEHGKLADIAPTMLKLMNIVVPKEMTGENLVK